MFSYLYLKGKMMKLGNKVVSKRTGFPGVGIIIAIQTSKFFVERNGVNPSWYIVWNELYDNWLEKPIIIVEYDEPRYVQTYKEYSQSLANISEYERKILYKYSRKANIIAYPIDDLEIFG